MAGSWQLHPVQQLRAHQPCCEPSLAEPALWPSLREAGAVCEVSGDSQQHRAGSPKLLAWGPGCLLCHCNHPSFSWGERTDRTAARRRQAGLPDPRMGWEVSACLNAATFQEAKSTRGKARSPAPQTSGPRPLAHARHVTAHL